MSQKPVGNVRAAIEEVWKRISAVAPVSRAAPTAPSGHLERWLVSHKGTRGVLGVVWHDDWFGAREKAEWVHKEYRDRLYIENMPLFPEELVLGAPMLSGAQIAERLGRAMHTETVVIDKNTGIVTEYTKTANGKAR